MSGIGPQHLVFFYLLPMALVAILYGSLPAMLCAVAATACAAFFLYDPVYSFAVANPVELGELVCFTGLALDRRQMRGRSAAAGRHCFAAKFRRPKSGIRLCNLRRQNCDAS